LTFTKSYFYESHDNYILQKIVEKNLAAGHFLSDTNISRASFAVGTWFK